MSDLPDFKQYCEPACIKLWGEPDKRTKKELRWNGSDAYGARTYDLRKHVWYDAAADRGGSTLELIAYNKGLPNEKLRGQAFFEMWKALVELGVGAPAPKPKSNDSGKPILATYPYYNENGVVLFEVVRFDTANPDERFRQHRPDDKGGWIWGTKGVRKVLFRLPELIAAVKAGQRVLVTEGEKDANTAVKLGYAATTMPGGVGKWLKQYDAFFAGADVVVVSDNDAHGKGQAHAAKLAKRLAKVAAHVRVIMFEQKDLTEWVEVGGTREQLDALIEQTKQSEEEQQPEQEPEQEERAADAEIERLAKLTAIEYEHQRKGAADKLGMRASILDRLVEGERARLNPDVDDLQGSAVSFEEIEPWPEPVDGPTLLDEIAITVRNHVVMSDYSRDICALWVVHSYLIKRFMISPKLSIRSAVKGCGKTTLLDVLSHLVFRALVTGSITKAALFRIIDMWHPTLLIDEVDSFVGDDEELRGMLNNSHRYDGAVVRTVGDEHEPRRFSIYAAVALSGIGGLVDTLADRSITTNLQRRRPSEPITQLRIGRMEHLHTLRRRIVRWVADHEERIAERDPEMPTGVHNREADNWHVLLAIADEADGKWPDRAREAAEASHSAESDDASRLELLLGDIRDVFVRRPVATDLFGKEDREISSAGLVKALHSLLARPWKEFGRDRKGLTQHGLARMLKPLGIGPDNVGPKNARVRGYKLSQFKDAFERYLPPEGVSECTPAHHAANTGTSDISEVHTQDDGCAVEKCEKPNNDGLVGGCALAKGVSGEKTHVRTAGPKSKSDDLPYTGSPVEVPDQGPDPLDAHGAPLGATNGGPEPGLSRRRIRELADWYSDENHRRYNDGTLDTAALDDELRDILLEEVFPEHVEIEFKRVIDVVFTV